MSNDQEPKDKIIRFPSQDERNQLRDKQKPEAEKLRRVQSTIKSANAPRIKTEGGANDAPFMNLQKITPFVRFLMVAFLTVQIPSYLLLSAAEKNQFFYAFGFVPGYFTGAFPNPPWSAPFGIVTHIFIHGSWMHLIFNAIMALAFGILFERQHGTRTTAIFFFACGIFGAAAYFAINPFSTAPVIGASGCINGLFAATIMMLSARGQMGASARYGPWPMLGFWLAFMLITGFLSGDDVAWQAHVGGFVGGAALYHLLGKGYIKF